MKGILFFFLCFSLSSQIDIQWCWIFNAEPNINNPKCRYSIAQITQINTFCQHFYECNKHKELCLYAMHSNIFASEKKKNTFSKMMPRWACEWAKTTSNFIYSARNAPINVRIINEYFVQAWNAAEKKKNQNDFIIILYIDTIGLNKKKIQYFYH